ncbi:hypothetical protein AX16_001778 [Volvariella volvacea WC 439]|nr:hypothetical protein AX16_001778 [Volvariella volvacea WC 439]
MPAYPYSRLVIGPVYTVAVAGPHLQLLDTKTGQLLASTTNLPDAEKQAAINSGAVLCIAIDPSSVHLVTSGEDKKMKVWEVPSLKLLSDRELPKRPTVIRFTADGQTIITADKFGDVFSYSLVPSPAEPKQKSDALASHNNPSGGELVLGHTSVLTDFVLSEDEKYIITSDRDEHIRASWYPQGYNIESYCLGHKKYVSAIHIPHLHPSVLVSGGGDPMLKVWDWMNGKLLQEISIIEAVIPFIKVTPPKRKRGWNESEEGGSSKRKFRKGKKGKGKQREGSPAEAENVDDDTAIKGEEDAERQETSANVGGSSGQEEKALVVYKIDSIADGAEMRLIFSVVGASAVFAVSLPSSNEAVVSEIKSFDFGVPVIDFQVTGNEIWVSLDNEWAGKEASLIKPGHEHVRVLTIPAGEKVQLVESTKATSLLQALNTHFIVSASQDELEKLDLYSNLISMPKHSDLESNPMDRDISEVHPDEQSTSGGAEGKQRSKKEIGRLKSKRAVAQALAGASRGAAQAGDDVPEAKRTKSEHDDNEKEMQVD